MENIPIGMESNMTTIAASNSDERRNMFAAFEFWINPLHFGWHVALMTVKSSSHSNCVVLYDSLNVDWLLTIEGKLFATKVLTMIKYTKDKSWLWQLTIYLHANRHIQVDYPRTLKVQQSSRVCCILRYLFLNILLLMTDITSYYHNQPAGKNTGKRMEQLLFDTQESCLHNKMII